MQGALRRAIADWGGNVNWNYDDQGWVVFLLHPERESIRGVSLREALAWCLVWSTVEEFSGGTLA